MPPIISLEPSQRPNSRAMDMTVRDLETKLVRHAAPTLAGMKPANLFTYRTGNFTEEEASSAIAEISSRLAGFHLRVEPLANRARGVLLLVFRPELVESALSNERARRLLTQSGFKDLSTEGVVSEIKRRIQAADASRAALVQTNSEAVPEPKPERFVPCCATGHHHDHGPNHVCQCRAKAALSREELETTQGESAFPARDRAYSWLPSSRCGGIHHPKRHRVSRPAAGGKRIRNRRAPLKHSSAIAVVRKNSRRFTRKERPLEALADVRSSAAISIFDMARAAV